MDRPYYDDGDNSHDRYEQRDDVGDGPLNADRPPRDDRDDFNREDAREDTRSGSEPSQSSDKTEQGEAGGGSTDDQGNQEQGVDQNRGGVVVRPWSNYSVIHVPGESIAAAGALSRKPLCDMGSHDIFLEESAEDFVLAALEGSSISCPTSLLSLASAQATDVVCRQLTSLILNNNWPTSPQNLPKELGPYWTVRSELSIVKNLLMRGHCLVIPRDLRPTVLQDLHRGHMGIAHCHQLAQSTVLWPELSTELTKLIQTCTICRHESVAPSLPLQRTPLPDWPWPVVGTDLCQFRGKSYLVIVDYFSRYPEVVQVHSTQSSPIIHHLKSVFARWGIPDVVCSDNGSQFSSEEFQQFSSDFGFLHRTSSPHYPQSNGAAEH